MGPPKEGKSFLALQVSTAVAQGHAFLGQASVQGPVWYLQLDTGEGIWRQRIRNLQEAGYDLGGPILMVHPEDTPRPFNIQTAATQTFVRDALKEANPTLIIIDVLRKFHSADENDSTEMKRVSDVMDELFVGRSVLVVHHTKKVAPGVENPDPNYLARGSSFITGQADALWLLFNGKLKLVSRFDETVTYRAERLETGLFHFPEILHRTQAQQKVLALCVEFPGEAHAQLAKLAGERWGMSRASYYRYLAGQECAHRLPHPPAAPAIDDAVPVSPPGPAVAPHATDETLEPPQHPTAPSPGAT